MPLVHYWTYGREALIEATATDIRSRLGHDFSAEALRELAEGVSAIPTWPTATLSFVMTVIVILLTGLLLNMGTAIAGSRLPPVKALYIAAAAALSVAVTRVGLWTLSLVITGTESVTGRTWLSEGAASLEGFAPQGMDGVLFYALFSMDVTLLIGTVVTAGLLMVHDQELPVWATVLLGLLWPVTVVAVRTALSTMVGFPV